jgi:hypothetical protein
LELIHATPAGAVDHVVVIHGELLVRAVVVRLARPRRHCGIIIVRTAMIRSRTNTAASLLLVPDQRRRSAGVFPSPRYQKLHAIHTTKSFQFDSTRISL